MGAVQAGRGARRAWFGCATAPLIHGNAQWAATAALFSRRHGRVRAAVQPARRLARRAAAQGERPDHHRGRHGAAADRGLPGGAVRPLLCAGDLQQRRAVLAGGQGRVPDPAAEHRGNRCDRRVGDRLHRPGLRLGRQQAGRGADGHARTINDRDRRAQPTGWPRRDRPTRARRPHPARLLQGPGQDRGPVRGGGRCPVRGARRPRQG